MNVIHHHFHFRQQFVCPPTYQPCFRIDLHLHHLASLEALTLIIQLLFARMNLLTLPRVSDHIS